MQWPVVVVLTLATAAWLHVLCVHPGSVPPEWNAQVAASPIPPYRLCPYTHVYKPPRAHYDVITNEVILNLDHSCPWVVSTIGFYNRKFFIQFLVYTTIYSILVIAFLGPHVGDTLDSLTASNQTSFVEDPNLALLHLWSVASHGLLVGPLALFTALHISMVCSNQTTIEDAATSAPFNVGLLSNLTSVFGSLRWCWLPIYCLPPGGDGVHWEGVGGILYGKAVPSVASASTKSISNQYPVPNDGAVEVNVADDHQRLVLG